MKKHIALILIIVLSSVQLTAQSPQGFNYQATVRNNAGELLVNQNANFQFTIVQGSPTGTSLYVESHTTQSDDLGQVVLRVGQGSTLSGDFSQIDWSLGSYYLAIELDTGNGYVSMGTTQLLSVPYALYADTAGNVEALQTQIDELVLLTDADNDGFSENQGDCDDTNATVYPGATEDESDGVDNDCDGEIDETLGYEATFYYFHGGQSAFPYASSYLTNETCMYYTPDITDGSATLSDAMTYIINEGGGDDPYNGGAGVYTMNSFEMGEGQTITDDGTDSYTQWTFPSNNMAEYYYLAIPGNSYFPENLITAPPYNLMDNGVPTNAADRKAFTYGGESYWLYRMGGGSNTISRAFGFNN
jgi:hypothetical protein